MLAPDNSLTQHPLLTPRDEERGWLSVTPDEMKEIESDLHGLHITPSPATCAARIEEEKDSAALSALEAEIAAIPEREKSAFLDARRICPESVDDVHRRSFLWREGFDAKLAAQRLVAYWQYKRELFGKEKCFLPLTLCGALSDDMIALSVGYLQLLPVRDQHGRAILFADPSRHDPSMYRRESMIRAVWYLLHVACEDPDVRERGMVLVVFPKNVSVGQFDPNLSRQLHELAMKYLPVLFRSEHICHPSMFFHLVNPIIKLVVGERLRKRIKVHYGSKEHVLQSLSKFGLSKDRVPSALGGDVVLDQVKWLSDRMMEEGLKYSSSPSSFLDDVGKSDVLSPIPKQQSRTTASESNVDAFSFSESDGFEAIFSSVSGEAGVAKETAPQPWLQSSLAVSGGDGCQVQSDEVENVMAVRRLRDRQSRRDESENGVVHADTSAYVPGGIDQAAVGPENAVSTIGQNSSLNLHPPRDHSTHLVHSRKVTSVNVVTSSLKTPEQSEPAKGSARRKMKGKVVGRGVQSATVRTSRRGDPRMNRAVEARMADPRMSLLDALIAGGFEFPASGHEGLGDQQIKDTDGVSLYQRKNQLNRRLREARKNDPRMDRALAAKLENPQLSLLDALTTGGFQFPLSGVPDICDRTIRDLENVSLFSRKNELSKRLGESNMTHIATNASSTGADLPYMNSKTNLAMLKTDYTSQVSAQAQISREVHAKHWQQQNAYSGGSEDQGVQDTPFPSEASFPSKPGMKAAGDKPSHLASLEGADRRKQRSDSFEESILELPGVVELEPSSVDSCKSEIEDEGGLIIDAWLWGAHDISPSCQYNVSSHVNFSFC